MRSITQVLSCICCFLVAIQKFLSDADFESLFSMARDKFDAQPAWKKSNAKKKHKLF
jgi:hypothetical protein